MNTRHAHATRRAVHSAAVPRKPKPTDESADSIRVSLLISVEDAKWVDGEAARLSAGEKFGRRLTRSDVIRALIRDAAGKSRSK
jgi:hypothetical protein